MKTKSNDNVTFIMTSCNRFDLLAPTLQSFLDFNTYPIEQFIFIEDTDKIDLLKKTIQKFPEVYKKSLLLFNEPKLGQIKSIDRAYSHVKTDYIFHCEEDWEFYRKGFIQDSLDLLKEDSSIINIWLRELNDTNNHPIDTNIHTSKNGKKYHFLTTNFLDTWHGFTFNPAVKRLVDYNKIGPFQNIGHEEEISNAYYKLGYKGAIFLEGSVKHQGWHRRVLDADKKRTKLVLEADAWIKKRKAMIYKFLGLFGKKYQ